MTNLPHRIENARPEDVRGLRWSFSPSYGQAMIRLRGRFYCLKAPWCRPLFSERYGHHTVIRLGFGWRIVIKDAAVRARGG